MSFSQKDHYKIVRIVVSGNEKTKLETILREIEFSDGDTIYLSELNVGIEKSKSNLTRTQLFNFIEVDTLIQETEVILNFSFQERWYYWIYPILEHSERNLSTFIYYRDFSRINYGVAFDWYNFRGRDEVLRFKTRLGYKEHYSIAYHKPGFGKRLIDGIWVFVDFFRQQKILYGLDSNMPVFWQNDTSYLKNHFDLGIEYSYRPKISSVFEFGLKYHQFFYNNDLFYNLLESKIKPAYLEPKIGYKYDNRNNLTYPVSGTYVNIRFAASLYQNADFSNSINISGFVQHNSEFFDSKFVLRNEIFMKKFIWDQTKPLLFDDVFNFFEKFVIRGYEYYYFPAKMLLGLRNTFSWKPMNIKFDIMPNVLPKEFSKFYSNVYIETFVDIAYSETLLIPSIIDDNFNNTIVYSVGAGLTFETYYDRLLQFHLAYNSCFNKIGIFVEFKTPIYKIY